MKQSKMTCNECRWKVEKGECPWDFLYIDTDWAPDCCDWRYINDPNDAFKNEEEQ